MSNESLSLPVIVPVSLNSLEPGTSPGDIIYWNGTRWISAPQDPNITSPIEIAQADNGFNPSTPEPAISGGYLYKKFGLPGLFWYPNGGPEVDLTSAGVSGGSTFPDGTFAIFNTTDNSKIMNFACSSVSPSTTRTFVVPNSNGILPAHDPLNYNLMIGQENYPNIGESNVFIGRNAGILTTSGSYNTAIGSSALNTNTTGLNNTSLGYQSLNAATTANQNTGIGSNALKSCITGYGNTSVGYQSLRNTTTGFGNIAVGTNALLSNITGSGSVAIGYNALTNSTTTIANTAVGYAAMQSNISGAGNTVFGDFALSNNLTGSSNVAFGHNALIVSTVTGNTALGFQTLESNTT